MPPTSGAAAGCGPDPWRGPVVPLPRRELGEEAVIEQVPEEVLRAARAAFDKREPQAEVAGLVEDLALVSPRGTIRLLRFAAGPLQVQVEVRRAGGGLGLGVDVRPSAPGLVALRHDGPPQVVRLDGDGHAELAPVAPGLVSLVLDDEAGHRTQTAWVRL